MVIAVRSSSRRPSPRLRSRSAGSRPTGCVRRCSCRPRPSMPVPLPWISRSGELPASTASSIHFSTMGSASTNRLPRTSSSAHRARRRFHSRRRCLTLLLRRAFARLFGGAGARGEVALLHYGLHRADRDQHGIAEILDDRSVLRERMDVHGVVCSECCGRCRRRGGLGRRADAEFACEADPRSCRAAPLATR